MKRALRGTILGLFLAFAFTAVAAAQESIETEITVSAVPAPVPEVADSVAATLTQADGTPVGGAEVEFRVQVELLGSRTAFLGSAVTGATGEARIPFVPRAISHTVEARFAGDPSAGLAATTGVGSVSFPSDRIVPPPIDRPESALSTLRTVVPRVMGIVVAALWIFFMVATVWVVRGVRRASSGSEGAMT